MGVEGLGFMGVEGLGLREPSVRCSGLWWAEY